MSNSISTASVAGPATRYERRGSAAWIRLTRPERRNAINHEVIDGINAGLNLGRPAGAGVPGHVHVHVLPRWTGDTNFMTTVAETRVLPEDLRTSWEKVRAAWPKT